MNVKKNAWQLRQEQMRQMYRAMTGNCHMSAQFRHGIKSWSEPNQSNRLAYKEAE